MPVETMEVSAMEDMINAQLSRSMSAEDVNMTDDTPAVEKPNFAPLKASELNVRLVSL